MDCFFCDQCSSVELHSQYAEMDIFLIGDELENVDAIEDIHGANIILHT